MTGRALAALAIPTILAAALLAATAPAQRSDDEKAQAEFERAERAVADAKYAVAVTLYEQLARRYGHTAWGKLAATRSAETAYLGWGEVQRNGPSSNRVDVVVMGDGYRLNDQNEFDDVTRSVVDVFRNHKVLGEYFAYHNFLRANLRSKDQGVSGFGRRKDTALGGFVTGAVQGQVGVDHGRCMHMLSQMPEHDGLAIAIVKAGSMGTGGGGVAAIGGRADDTLVHEWGHAFAGLSDEYSTFTGHRGAVPNAINISNSDDPKQVPWRHWIEAGVPGVGVYRGGDGRIKGAWKPTAGGCAMEGGTIFCEVCREALLLNVYRYVDPIDGCEPEVGRSEPIYGGAPFQFEVTVMKPKSHHLEVSWWVLPKAEAIQAAPSGPFADRRQRGKLAEIRQKPDRSGSSSSAKAKFTTARLEPGIYQVVCRVRDEGRPSGQQWPWVLKDDLDLLVGERVWWIEVK
jgi:hypothetical protein